MKVAVLSGKGGTGKTFVSVNLAAVAEKSVYIDCDVEEPNGHLFFKPERVKEESVYIKIPSVDDDLCNGCRKCDEFCKFNALAFVNDRLMVFDDVCHSCGGCVLVCPQRAISEKNKMIGKIQSGISDNVTVKTGILNSGETSGIPIIERLLDESSDSNSLTFIDCPPGSACSVMKSIEDADYCILVAEPTLFGLYNLDMVYELVRLYNKPFGVVLNKCFEENNPTEEYCKDRGITILTKIPYDNKLGEINSHALIAVRESKYYRTLFLSLLQTELEEVQNETTVDSQR